MPQRGHSPDDDVVGDEIDEVLGRANPNPERIGCPPRETLVELAQRARPIGDPAYKHLLKCSPCYVEVRTLQVAGAGPSRSSGRPSAWLALAATLILAVVGGLLWRQSRQEPVAQPPSAVVAKSEPPASRPVGVVPPATPVPLRADLRKFTVFRSADGESRSGEVVALRPELLDLTLMLPVGSEPGAYEVQLLDSGLQSLATGKGAGAVENFVTTVRVRLDLRQVPKGSHQLAVRRGDDEWRLFTARVD
jgi:hypothetical protein